MKRGKDEAARFRKMEAKRGIMGRRKGDREDRLVQGEKKVKRKKLSYVCEGEE